MSREDHEDWLPFDSGTMPSIEEDEDRKKSFVDGLSKLSRTTMEKLFDHFENFFGKRGCDIMSRFPLVFTCVGWNHSS